MEQECILLECIPTSVLATTRCQYRSVPTAPLEAESTLRHIPWRKTSVEVAPSLWQNPFLQTDPRPVEQNE